MNSSDSEIVASIMQSSGYHRVEQPENANVLMFNTCAVRENAEQKVWERLKKIKSMLDHHPDRRWRQRASVGVLGCMAERLKKKLLETDRLVDFVAGPDAYRDIPNLLNTVESGQKAMNVQLSLDETYADVAPVRYDGNGISAYISIMRGCNNMCSYCVVPFTRGRERSRTLESIVNEVKDLSAKGYREITLLGQNVNSYWDQTFSEGSVLCPKRIRAGYVSYPGFNNIYKSRHGSGARFIDLLDQVSAVDSRIRIRFTSPHPKDFPPQLLQLIAERPNLCKSLHMPAQSGSTSVLARMRRGYTREAYMQLIEEAQKTIPGLSISTDIITGFCGETEEEHQETLSLLEEVKFYQAFMYAYSERSHTHAKHNMPDDVPQEIKSRRLQEIIDTFRKNAAESCLNELGKEHVVLIDGPSKRSSPEMPQLVGRTCTNKLCVWDVKSDELNLSLAPGDYVKVKVLDANAATLKVQPLTKLNA
ncbi:hypothetical protein GUITHDRAFT_160013 [Guillardia theta CCMP2712]|uniref:Uncharacterized protein n=1 Tax=Guillardia theta (strain CCMP2712) TaxID=905079 RepID=L1ISV6_GUITC|nr:hypothetical protein GUITHDRAFT_160013 [Guillardia theta CCMP2712]EKX39298.1 hypothetical protein GUITHDRAFT_160013 [Guillardia theta CCMP2712]|eukprot:XP_005826278.1 hypothetical protein GUITHDRAFT_160013 [Guillardia theta CCMP2712]